MKQIQCPKCGEVFAIDESAFNDILVQVKNQEFNKEVDSKVKDVEARMAAETKAAVAEIEKEVSRLKAEKTALETAQKQAIEAEVAKTNANNASNVAELKQQIAELKGKLDLADKDAELKLKDALAFQEKTIAELKSAIELNKKEATIREQELNAKNKAELMEKDNRIQNLLNWKNSLSVKLQGESLEQHCMALFNKYRTTMFPNAYFEKDNELSSDGTKGDFIFKDYASLEEKNNGEKPYISILFEMKNEIEGSKTKQKNEKFFEKLNKDRKLKGCEYAVLVSVLEPESELYSEGIVDVSYAYEKMYVIRPQYFMSLISLLSNASKNSIGYQKEIIRISQQNIDLTKFESKLKDFKEDWLKTVKFAGNNFKEAMDSIQKTIDCLTDIKENLRLAGKQLLKSGQKADDITLRELTNNNPTMKQKFIEAGIKINDDSKEGK